MAQNLQNRNRGVVSQEHSSDEIMRKNNNGGK